MAKQTLQVKQTHINQTQVKQSARTAGLEAASNQQWTAALVYLHKTITSAITSAISSATAGSLINDLALFDAFGEAAYRSDAPEVLGPYQNYYKYPSLAVHMARAFLMLGDQASAQEFLNYSVDSPLKAALKAMLQLNTESEAGIKQTAAAFFPVAEAYPNLNYPEFWRTLAPISDAMARQDLTLLAERNSKAQAYADPHIHFNQALRYLSKGEFRAGWRLYEWRLVPSPTNRAYRMQLGKISMWEGENLDKKTLLVFLEQGLGDGIFSLRYVALFLEQGIKIQVVARKAILPLLKSSFANIQMHDEDEVVVVDYWHKISKATQPDYWVYALSIPYRSDCWQPAQTAAFLKVEPEIINKKRKLIQVANPKNLPVYCINWYGRVDTESDRTRAFSVEEFAEVAGLRQAPAFVISLQKDATTSELEKWRGLIEQSGGSFYTSESLSGESLNTLADTAALIAASARLLTCDTSVAHVGGAIGHPTTVFARNKAIWQWRHQGGKSVWYDSVTVTHALSPQVSWLFAKIAKSENTAKGPQNITNQNIEKNSSDKGFSFAGRNSKKIKPAGRTPLLTDEMKAQLLEQIGMQINRGNPQAAEVIRQFLNQTEKTK